MKTDPAPPPSMSTLPPRTDEDTGPTSQSQVFQARAAIAILDALEASEETRRAVELARYAIDKTIGDVADEEAKRSPTRLARIEANMASKDDIAMLKKLIADLATSILADHQKIIELDTWKRRHSVAPHCDTCEFKHPEIEAQEG